MYIIEKQGDYIAEQFIKAKPYPKGVTDVFKCALSGKLKGYFINGCFEKEMIVEGQWLITSVESCFAKAIFTCSDKEISIKR